MGKINTVFMDISDHFVNSVMFIVNNGKINLSGLRAILYVQNVQI